MKSTADYDMSALSMNILEDRVTITVMSAVLLFDNLSVVLGIIDETAFGGSVSDDSLSQVEVHSELGGPFRRGLTEGEHSQDAKHKILHKFNVDILLTGEN